jgi:hypothetical protein
MNYDLRMLVGTEYMVCYMAAASPSPVQCFTSEARADAGDDCIYHLHDPFVHLFQVLILPTLPITPPKTASS